MIETKFNIVNSNYIFYDLFAGEKNIINFVLSPIVRWHPRPGSLYFSVEEAVAYI